MVSCSVFTSLLFIQQLALMGEPEENSVLQTVTRGSVLLKVGSALSVIIHDADPCCFLKPALVRNVTHTCKECHPMAN